MLRMILNFFGGGVLDRIFDTVDKRIEGETDRAKIKGDILQTHLKTRAGFMEAGGFILMMLWAVPAALHFASVVVYSILWCQGCAYPQEWTIAALPAREANWAGAIVMSIFGVVGVTRWKR